MTLAGPEAPYEPPTPIRLRPIPVDRRVVRQARTLSAFARHVGVDLGRKGVLGRDVPPRVIARGLRSAFDELGSTYVKFGQLIASSPGAFGAEVADEFRSLLDQGDPVPFERVRAVVERSFRAPLEQTFAWFDPEPLAAASVAVVHRARLADGRDVAVKVVRPGMAARVALDLDLMQPLFRRLGLMGVEIGGVLYRYLAGFRRQVSEELDLRNEARAMVHFRTVLRDAGLTSITIPEPVEPLVTQRVLVMELLDGVPIDELSAIEDLGVDPTPLVRQLMDFWFLTGLRDGVFHGDIHAGNLMLLRDGRLGLIDWGIVGVLDERTRTVFRRFVSAVLGDAAAWADVAAFMREMMPFAPDDMDELLQEGGQEIGAMLTRPFGEVDLGEAMRNGRGTPPEGESPAARAERRTRIRRQRRFERQALKSGVADSDFGQANFLLFKQLLYFDRYGKLYLADQALLGNTPFIRRVLDEIAPA